MTSQTPRTAPSSSVSVAPIFHEVMALNECEKPQSYVDYLIGYAKRISLQRNLTPAQSQYLVAYPEPRSRLKRELESAEVLSHTKDGLTIYLLDHQINSSVLREIGRLRALTFKVVGEGTKKMREVDAFDKTYRHIVLWNAEDEEIVGAYRIGEAHRLSALYTERLFDYQPKFRKLFSNAIELGRSFVQPKYWSKRGLDYLWLGIGAYLVKHPEVRYLFGAVSISNEYPTLAKHQIVGCYQHFYQPANHRGYARSRQPFAVDRGILESYQQHDFASALLRLKKDLKQQNVTLPTLYKHYADLCSEGGISFIDFNVDPEFSNCIDGLMLVDLKHIKDKKRRRYLDVHLGEQSA